MDITKLIDSLETVFYEVFGLLVPAACLCALMLPFLPTAYWSDAVRLEPAGPQYVAVVVLLYILGVFLNAARKTEAAVLAAIGRFVKRGKSEKETGTDPASAYPDRNIYRAARDQIAAHFGMPADALSDLEVFNLCLSVAGDRAVAYRKFVSLRDMMRGMGFAVTVAVVATLTRLTTSPSTALSIAPFAKLTGVHLAGTLNSLGGGRLFYAGMLVVLVVAKWAFFGREKRYEGIGRRIIYPLALQALRSAPGSQEKREES